MLAFRNHGIDDDYGMPMFLGKLRVLCVPYERATGRGLCLAGPFACLLLQGAGLAMVYGATTTNNTLGALLRIIWPPPLIALVKVGLGL